MLRTLLGKDCCQVSKAARDFLVPLTSASHLQRNALKSDKREISSSSSGSGSSQPHVATFLPGDGIGPEIAKSVKQVFQVAGVPMQWEDFSFSTDFIDPKTNSMVTREALDNLLKNNVGLKGPMATPIGKGHRSLNLTLRKELGLYANIRPCFSIPGYKTKYDNVNLVTIRENTEGEYSGLEHEGTMRNEQEAAFPSQRKRSIASDADAAF